MDFYYYQTCSSRTLPEGLNRNDLLANLCLGLAGESGEFVDVMKKHLYHGHDLDVDAMKSEMGDILWYLSSLASSLDINLNEVAEMNVEKLSKRYPDGFDKARSQNRGDR